MGKHDTQRAAYEFLLEHLLSGKPFKLAEFLGHWLEKARNLQNVFTKAIQRPY